MRPRVAAMHNVSTRANTIVTFAITVLGVFAALNAFTMYIFTYTSVINAGNFKAEWAKSFDNIDEGHVSIDLTHDLSGVFNRTNKLNPWREHTVVHVLYCSGDAHAGNVARNWFQIFKGKVNNNATGEFICDFELKTQVLLDEVQAGARPRAGGESSAASIE